MKNKDSFFYLFFFTDKFSFIKLLTNIVMWIFGALVFIGSLIPEDKIEMPEYTGGFDPYPSYYGAGRIHNTEMETPPNLLNKYPDYYDCNSGHWEEFLEDLDEMGITPWSPEAEEYYDANYGY